MSCYIFPLWWIIFYFKFLLSVRHYLANHRFNSHSFRYAWLIYLKNSIIFIIFIFNNETWFFGLTNSNGTQIYMFLGNFTNCFVWNSFTMNLFVITVFDFHSNFFFIFYILRFISDINEMERACWDFSWKFIYFKCWIFLNFYVISCIVISIIWKGYFFGYNHFQGFVWKLEFKLISREF